MESNFESSNAEILDADSTRKRLEMESLIPVYEEIEEAETSCSV